MEKVLATTQVAERVCSILDQLTLDEKAAMSAGSGIFALHGVERLGIPNLPVTDGPNGARGSSMFGSGEARAVCVPCGSALGATWNPDLIEQIGQMLGDETRTKCARVLLAPTVNLHRSPLGGRNFECYSEDPLLSGKIAAAFIRGVQSRGVITTVKHFVGNDAETERHTMNSVIDDRTLREVYLFPFELAVREGGSLGIMTGYNRLNGVYCAENEWLLTDVLRGDWGFEGVVMTDWFSAATTSGSIHAGLDIEMPGLGRAYGPALAEAVRSGQVDEWRLNEIVTRQLTALARIGALDDETRPEQSIDLPGHRQLARRASAESLVLLKNDNVLPLSLVGDNATKSIAVIGPNANRTQIMGGGSANLRPMHRQSILEALQQQFGDQILITYEPGCAIDRTAPSLGGATLVAPSGGQGFDIDVFANDALQGEPVACLQRETGRLLFMNAPAPDVEMGNFSFRAKGTYTATVGGAHSFEIIQMGHSQLFVDGQLKLDGLSNPPGPGTTYFGMGSETITCLIDMPLGSSHEVVLEWRVAPGAIFCGVDLGCRLPLPNDPIAAAVTAASAADAVILVVGTNDDWETEGEDRGFMDLPGDQDELVRRVLSANPKTVVVVNTGSPVTMPWADQPGAILQAWFGGQEMGNAVVDVIVGAEDPSGRLPTTLPLKLEHNPSFGNFPGERSELRYGEGVFVGYRWYRSRALATRFPFGHGLSYTTFEIGQPTVSSPNFTAGSTLQVSVEIRNTGTRRGAQVVQCYLSPTKSELVRPEEELKAFQKVWLEPGETRTVTMTLTDRSFAYWDPSETGWGERAQQYGPTMIIVPLGDRNEVAGWRIDAGTYEVRIATSCDAIVGTATVTVEDAALLPANAS